MPLLAVVISPAANGGRRRVTSGAAARLSIPGIDWWRWLSLRWLREHRRHAEKQAVLEALVRSSGGAKKLGRWLELVDGRARCAGDNGGRWRCERARGRDGSYLNRRAGARGGVGASPRSKGVS
jgi:hypothetical protein